MSVRIIKSKIISKGRRMFKKIITGVLVLGMTSLFAMSLSTLNSASKAELMEINGIGEKKAAAIIKERKKGKFKSFDDLTRVKGIGEQITANAKNDVKSASDVKKVSKKTKTKAKKKTVQKDVKKDVKEKATEKTKKTTSKTKKRKIKSMDEKKKELKSKAKKTKTKKTKAKKTKPKKKN